MTRKYWLWLGFMLLVAGAGAWMCGALASRAVPADDPHLRELYLKHVNLPIGIVQLASNWSVLLAVWATFAALAYGGWRLTEELSTPARPRFGPLLFSYAAVALALSFFPIAQSIDPYYYTLYGRLYGVYGINPYSLPQTVQTADLTLRENLIPLGNPPFADPYGGGFTLIAGLIGRFEKSAGVWLQLWSWRVMVILSVIAAAAALAHLLRQQNAAGRIRRVARFTFHPLVLYESGVGSHNDMLMVAFGVWAFALVDELPLVAGLLLGSAIAIKYVAAIVAPFLVLRAARKNVGAAAILAALAVLVPFLCSRPFALQHAATGLAQVGSGLSMSLNWLLAFPFFRTGLGHAPAIAAIPALPYLGQLTWPRVMQLALVAALGVILAQSVVRFARDARMREVLRPVAALIWVLPAMHAWYLSWLVPAVTRDDRWATYAWCFGALSLLAYAHEGVVATPANIWLFAGLTVLILVAPIIIARLTRRTALQDETASARRADSLS